MEPSSRASACPACGAPVAAEAKYCGQCAYPLAPQRAASDAAKSRWYHSVGFVLAMLFFVMGPFALPLLWKSPRFALWAKIALTLLLIAATWWGLSVGITVFRAVMDHMNQPALFGF